MHAKMFFFLGSRWLASQVAWGAPNTRVMKMLLCPL